jgi:hypothetical protein
MTMPPSRSGWATGLAAGCLVSMLGVCGIGAATVYWIASRLGLVDTEQLDVLAQLVLVLLVVAAGHAAASGWAWRTRPGAVRMCLTQTPHVATYAAVPFWWSGTWSAWFILWGAGTLAALAWLTVWYLQNPRSARRAAAYLTALAVLVAGNTAGVIAAAWRHSNGFGWKGQPTPWAAFIAMSATSCLSEHGYHNDGSRLAEADCPTGPDGAYYSGDYDEDAFNELLCDEQPRSAFRRWWDWNRDYQIQFILTWDQQRTVVDGQEITPPYPDHVDGERADVDFTMTVTSALHAGPEEPYTAQADTVTEAWHVTFETVALGGWKVCRIDIPDPIRLAFRKN